MAYVINSPENITLEIKTMNDVGVGAVGKNSTSMGDTTLSYGDNSFSDGVGTIAFGDNSMSVGLQTIASGENSFAKGTSSEFTPSLANIPSAGVAPLVYDNTSFTLDPSYLNLSSLNILGMFNDETLYEVFNTYTKSSISYEVYTSSAFGGGSNSSYVNNNGILEFYANFIQPADWFDPSFSFTVFSESEVYVYDIFGNVFVDNFIANPGETYTKILPSVSCRYLVIIRATDGLKASYGNMGMVV